MKKKTPSPKRKSTLDKAILFYIEAHADKKTPQEIAQDLELTEEVVTHHLGQLQNGTPGKRKKDKFSRRGDSVSMTQGQAEADDTPPPKTTGRRKGGIHTFWKDEPTF